MIQYNITIPENKENIFIEIMKSLNFVKKISKKEEYMLSDKQKAILNKRLDNYNPDNLLDWDDVKKEIEKGL
ncbi:MAG: hypothetical protein WC223_06825 [Bacteroidales bacterium]|jgi:hypothetical protein